MLCFYFVRHVQTLSNIQHTLQGWSDTPLTDLGIQQGKLAYEKMKTVPFLSIYASPSNRAYKTACYIRGSRQQKIIKLENLKEMHFGMMEGKPEDFHCCHSSIDRINYDWHRFGGETIDDVTLRLKQVLNQLVQIHQGQTGNILCVTHGISILAAIRAVDDKVYRTYLHEQNFIKNGDDVIIRYEHGGFIVE